LLLQGDESAAELMMCEARRREDEAMAAFVRQHSRRYRWPGVHPLPNGDYLHLKTGLLLRALPDAAPFLKEEGQASLSSTSTDETSRAAFRQEPVLLGLGPVSQRLFWRFVQLAPRWAPQLRKASAFLLSPLFGWPQGRPDTGELDRPVHSVPWSAARDFCNWAELDLPRRQHWQRVFEHALQDEGEGTPQEWCEDAFDESANERLLVSPRQRRFNAEWPELVAPGVGFRVALVSARECSLAMEQHYASLLEQSQSLQHGQMEQLEASASQPLAPHGQASTQ
jgi:hypothetical protein